MIRNPTTTSFVAGSRPANGAAGRRRGESTTFPFPAHHGVVRRFSVSRRLRPVDSAVGSHRQPPLTCYPSLVELGHLCHWAAHPSSRTERPHAEDPVPGTCSRHPRRDGRSPRWPGPGRRENLRPAVDPNVTITLLFCFEVALVALGGGYLIRYEVRRDHRVLDREGSRSSAACQLPASTGRRAHR